MGGITLFSVIASLQIAASGSIETIPAPLDPPCMAFRVIVVLNSSKPSRSPLCKVGEKSAD